MTLKLAVSRSRPPVPYGANSYLVGVSAYEFVWCFDTVGHVTESVCNCRDSHSEQTQEGSRGLLIELRFYVSPVSFLRRSSQPVSWLGSEESKVQPRGTWWWNGAFVMVDVALWLKLGDRGFSVASPRLWNDLPPRLRRSGLSFDTFRKSLKTYLFGDRSA